MISKEDQEKVCEFFNNNQILTECFLQLFEYQKLSVSDVELEFREGLIGFKREGEVLRLYVIKDKNGVYRIKIKAATSHVFIPAEMINFQSDIDKNNILFSEKREAIKIGKKKTKKVTKKSKNIETKLPKIKRASNKRGVQRFIVSNLMLDNIQPLLDCLSEFKRDGIKKVKIRITEEDK